MSDPPPKRAGAVSKEHGAPLSRDPVGPSAKKDGAPRSREDVVLLGGKTRQGGVAVLRKRDDELSVGELLPLREGQPLRGEVVSLKRRDGVPAPLYDVNVEYTATETDHKGPARVTTDHKGPARVTTDQYRDNWDRIWPRRATGDDDAPN